MEKQLLKDMENMENCMIRLGERTDIWQDRMIYVIAKAVFDLCRWAVRREKSLKEQEPSAKENAAFREVVLREIKTTIWEKQEVRPPVNNIDFKGHKLFTASPKWEVVKVDAEGYKDETVFSILLKRKERADEID